MIQATKQPIEIKLLQKTKRLELVFPENEQFSLPCYYVRQHSPSAENRYSKSGDVAKEVNIIAIEPVGNYAVKLVFDDGHDTGIYSWDKLYQLGKNFKTHE